MARSDEPPGDGEDLLLFMRWRTGDGAAGETLVARYYPRVLGFFRGKASPGAVEELVQQTFVACVEGRDRMREPGSFGGYLFGVARFTLYDHYRRRRRDDRLDPLVTTLYDLDPSPSTAFRRDEARRRLAEALRHIPLDLQIMLELHYWEGLSTAQLAEAIGVPHGTAKSRLERAKRLLRERLGDERPIASRAS